MALSQDDRLSISEKLVDIPREDAAADNGVSSLNFANIEELVGCNRSVEVVEDVGPIDPQPHRKDRNPEQQRQFQADSEQDEGESHEQGDGHDRPPHG